MKTVLFKIVKRTKIEFEENTLAFIRKNPTHFQQLSEAEEIFITLDYRADKNLNEAIYIERMKRILKRKYNAYSIEVGTIEKQIEN